MGKPDVSDRIWFLHLLRAVAVLGVLFSHVVSGPWAQSELHARYANVRQPDLSSLDSSWDNPLLVPLIEGPFSWPYKHGVDPGAAGVGLFFLISGILIPMALDRRRPVGFLITRFFRIFPVWIACLGIAALWFLAYTSVTGMPFPSYSLVDWGVNAGLVTDWFPLRPVINPVAWTLLIEWKFYLLCAGLAALGALHRPAAILCLVAALVGLGVAGHEYLLRHAYSGEFLQTLASIPRDSAPFLCVTFVGVCFYHRLVGRWSTRTCVLMVGALWLLLITSLSLGVPDWAAGPVRIKSFTAAGVVFLAVYVFRGRIPYSRFLSWVADISYPMYAVHYLLGVGVMFTVYALLPIPVLAQAASVAVTFVASAVLHRWVEQPANDFGKSLSPAEPRATPDEDQVRSPSGGS